VSWPACIPAGQVIDQPAAAMDAFPTLLAAGGGDPSQYELDGVDLMPMLLGQAAPVERDLYWEMKGQTAVRRGPWKLVLQGQLVEGVPPEDDVHLSNLDEDMGERHNLRGQYPDLVSELSAAALAWREGIESRWQNEWLPAMTGTTTHPQA
jgi:arylsulfatase A-like enzyme